MITLKAGIRLLAVVCCALLGWSGHAIAEDAAPQLTRADLETWLDGFLPYAMQRGDIAGAAVVVVRDGEVLLSKGYGYADLAARVPVDPQRTLFRMASVSKVFTWTAVMQQVEQGKLDLDRDVNEYLDFKIQPAFGKPVTVRNLMTHSAGFEETIRGMVVYDPASPTTPIGEYLKANQPARIYPPGEVHAYSNYGTTLAGYIVELVSGEPYLDYMDKHVLGPLEMRQSTFRQPLPEALKGQLSKGYPTASQSPQRFEGVVAAPAGSLSATPMDMGKFMIAHLQDGRFGAGQILRPETARLMHARTIQTIAGINGMAIGFFQQDRNGHRIIGHAGDTGLFHSNLLLYLDDGVGVFMTVNSTGPGLAADGIRSALFEQFTDRYFPAELPPEPTAATAVEHARLVEGRYEMSRGFTTNFMTAPGLFEQFEVKANPDGTLAIDDFAFSGLNGQPIIWREVAPFVWRDQAGKERLAARVRDGRVVGVSRDKFSGILELRPVSTWQSAAWNVPLLFVSVVVLVVGVIVWPVSVWRGSTSTGREALAKRLTNWAVLTSLVSLLGWATVIIGSGSNREVLDGSLDPWLRLLQLLGLVGALGALVAVWNAWQVCKAERRLGAKAWSVVLAVACLGVAWFGFAFKLITPGLRY